MKYRRQEVPWMLLLVASLLGLLVLLATLQYRWMGQVSEAGLERLQANLRRDVFGFSQEFDGELSRACINFAIAATPRQQFEAASLHASIEEQFARRYRRWVSSATYPRLIGDLFSVELDAQARARLFRFDPDTEKLEASDWPDEFTVWRRWIEEHFERWGAAAGPLRGGPVDFVAEEVPAFIIPFLRIPAIREGPGFGASPLPAGFSIVKIDRQYLQQEFIPMLVRRYFSGAGGAREYDLAVITRSTPATAIYQSDPALQDLRSASADATIDLLALRLDALQAQRREAAGPPDPRQVERPLRNPPLRSFVFPQPRRGSGGWNPAGPWPGGRDSGRWQLVVRHRGGSLEAVVDRARQRNLMISFSILLLLGLSMALIVIATQREQRLARQQMNFVAGVSHELRTPLAVICSAGENLADGLVTETNQVRRYGGLVREEGRRLSAMMEQILEFAGIQSGRKQYDLRLANVAEIIDRAEAACSSQIQEKQIEVEKDVQADLPPVKADAAALSHSIQNLLINAIKYGGESPWLKIAARSAAGRQGPELQITVQDRGLGIPSGDLPHIFEPFYRGQGAIATQIHGNGLGLSLVKNVIEGHGGRVSVESQPGRGSAFTLHLPAAVPLAARDRQQAAPAQMGRG